MSSRVYADRRPLPPTIVAEKASLYRSRKSRRLLLFLQAASIKDGGIGAIAADLIAMFPERLCTPFMRERGVVRQFTEEDGRAIEMELHGNDYVAYLQSTPSARASNHPRAYFQDHCREIAENSFAEFITELCINPALDLEKIVENKWYQSALYFFDPIGAIEEYRRRRAESVRGSIVMTTVGTEVHRLLDNALSTQGLNIIQGEPGWGKSEGAKSWSRMHLGEAVYVTLESPLNRTIFFQTLATAIGLATSGRTCGELQAKVSSYFQRTKVALVIDEGHHLWPASLRVYKAPELIDYINTGLINHDVPVAIVTTDQFAKAKARVEAQTAWTSKQFSHRVQHYELLCHKPTFEDVKAVAARMLQERWSETADEWLFDPSIRVNEKAVVIIAKYAFTEDPSLPRIRALVREARVVARRAGRDAVALEDLKTAQCDVQIASDSALVSFKCVAADRGGRIRVVKNADLSRANQNEQMSTVPAPSPEVAHHPRMAALSVTPT